MKIFDSNQLNRPEAYVCFYVTHDYEGAAVYFDKAELPLLIEHITHNCNPEEEISVEKVVARHADPVELYSSECGDIDVVIKDLAGLKL